MVMNKSKILWVDDEIDHLKSHILFLQERGYKVTPVTNAEDAVSLVEKEPFDVILLDEMMPGLSGLEAVSIFKEKNPSIPVIMITKSEEENLMEDAIGENIDDYLTKPVNPSQILSSCKRILERKRITNEKMTRHHTTEFRKISSILNGQVSVNDWIDIYIRLSQREIELDHYPNPDLRQILCDLHRECNKVFADFIESNYSHWVSGEGGPLLSPDIISKYVFPLLKRNERVLFILIDNLRLDQWMFIEPMMYDLFSIKREHYYSILPTATPYSRNSIFAGMFPRDIEKVHHELWKKGDDDESSRNRFEHDFLNFQLERKGVHLNRKTKYVRIINQNKSRETVKKVNEFFSVPLSVMVFNFVDILSHRRNDSQIIQEIIPDESAYRSLTKTWFEHSDLYEILKAASQEDIHIVLTTDHGSIRAMNGSIVRGDRETSTNLRYKYGRGIRGDRKESIMVKDPGSFGLPRRSINTNFLIARENYYFVYPTNYRKYLTLYKDSFQHGGVSLEEMILPVVLLKGKK